jgi:hypothetical protein
MPPYANSAVINQYWVYIKDSTGNFLLEQTYCKGDVLPVLGQHYCEVPMSVLSLAPYSLIFDN